MSANTDHWACTCAGDEINYGHCPAYQFGEHGIPASQRAGLGVGHIWTAVQCPAYRTYAPADCTCREVIS